MGPDPGRSTWDAAEDIFLSTRSIATNFSGKILELDVEKCFDRIDHKYQMQTICLPKQYKMGVWRALKAGVKIGYEREDTTEGTPQGGVFSPLLANLALLVPRKIRDLGIGRKPMKLVVVTQWVRVDKAQVPPDQSLASRSVANPRATPVMGCTKPEVARRQAV
jgi:retron-type reverse transcriptase